MHETQCKRPVAALFPCVGKTTVNSASYYWIKLNHVGFIYWHTDCRGSLVVGPVLYALREPTQLGGCSRDSASCSPDRFAKFCFGGLGLFDPSQGTCFPQSRGSTGAVCQSLGRGSGTCVGTSNQLEVCCNAGNGNTARRSIVQIRGNPQPRQHLADGSGRGQENGPEGSLPEQEVRLPGYYFDGTQWMVSIPPGRRTTLRYWIAAVPPSTGKRRTKPSGPRSSTSISCAGRAGVVTTTDMTTCRVPA